MFAFLASRLAEKLLMTSESSKEALQVQLPVVLAKQGVPMAFDWRYWGSTWPNFEPWQSLLSDELDATADLGSAVVFVSLIAACFC